MSRCPKPISSLQAALLLFLCLSGILSAQPPPSAIHYLRENYRFPFMPPQSRLFPENALFWSFDFDTWKGKCEEPGKIIANLAISADFFPSQPREYILCIDESMPDEESAPNTSVCIRIQHRKDRLDFSSIRIRLFTDPLSAQKAMIHDWAIWRNSCSMYMDPGVRLDAELADDYKLYDASVMLELDPFRSPPGRHVKYIDDDFRFMIFDDYLKYRIGDHCIYSKHNYLSFSRNNAMVSIRFRQDDERNFLLAQFLDAKLHSLSMPSTTEQGASFSPSIVLDDSGFSPRPAAPRRHRSLAARLRAFSRKTESIYDDIRSATKSIWRKL